MRFTTRLLHEAFAPDAATGATTQPLYQTSAFYQPTAEEMARAFGVCLIPDYYPCPDPRLVSCYALFE